MGEPHGQAFHLECGEVGGIVAAGDWQMLSVWLQILSDPQNVAIHCPQVVHDVAGFAERLPHFQSQVGLRR